MVSQKTIELFAQANKDWEPKRRLTVSQWADANRILTTESSAEAGPWRTDRAPYQREIMDSIETWEEVAIMASAQVGKTEFLLNVTGSYIDQDPCPIMHVLPNDSLIQAYSKKRLTPMINSSDALRAKVGVSKSRDSSNTIEDKSFPGGYVTIVGANVPADLSSRPVQVVLCDEVDRFPVSSGKEGDPISLAIARTTTFKHKRRHLFVSTPVDAETSRIYELYKDSSMEQWNLPCPHCGELQPLKFKDRIVFEHYESESGEIVVTKAECRCEFCGLLGSEKDWKRGQGAWIAAKIHTKRRGFHINQLASPWSDWREVAKKFLIAKREGVDKLKVFINTVLGEPWEENKTKIDETVLMNRQETYEYDVPEGVKVLTAAVDTQNDRFEVEVIGWGAGKESWRIEYHRIYGDLHQDTAWNELDEYLKRRWTGFDGKEFPIVGAFIDSGGHFTKEVYEFTAPRNSRKIFAIKGRGIGPKTAKYIPFIAGHSKTQLQKATLISLGVDDGKTKVMDSLKVEEPGPLYCHFPREEKGYTHEYFLGLLSEVQKKKRMDGVEYRTWVQIRDRNEPFDLAVYNRGVIELLKFDLNRMAPYCFDPQRQVVARSSNRRRGTSSSV
ncbi:phage terminase large subunit family protein [Paenibacillus agilis]|nr:phage terminase large subunit family protein [Paenibacillus agilis]